MLPELKFKCYSLITFLFFLEISNPWMISQKTYKQLGAYSSQTLKMSACKIVKNKKKFCQQIYK